ncbi:NUDIX domain-containing protein [Actinosynnema sp. CA-248983]
MAHRVLPASPPRKPKRTGAVLREVVRDRALVVGLTGIIGGALVPAFMPCGGGTGRDRTGGRAAVAFQDAGGMSIRTVSSKVVYENRWLSVREDRIELADGSPGLYSVVDKPDFALVIPFEDDGFHLVEQYRYPIGTRSWEFPSGSFPSGVTGTAEEMAAAELAEETGIRAGRLRGLGFAHCANGFATIGVHVFLATELTRGEPAREVTEQDMRHRWFPRAEVEDMIRDGRITDSPTLTAYLLLTLKKRSLQDANG